MKALLLAVTLYLVETTALADMISPGPLERLQEKSKLILDGEVTSLELRERQESPVSNGRPVIVYLLLGVFKIERVVKGEFKAPGLALDYGFMDDERVLDGTLSCPDLEPGDKLRIYVDAFKQDRDGLPLLRDGLPVIQSHDVDHVRPDGYDLENPARVVQVARPRIRYPEGRGPAQLIPRNRSWAKATPGGTIANRSPFEAGRAAEASESGHYWWFICGMVFLAAAGTAVIYFRRQRKAVRAGGLRVGRVSGRGRRG